MRQRMKTPIKEYVEGLPVEVLEVDGHLVVQALNEGGNNGTRVDLIDVVNWVVSNRPDLITTSKSRHPEDKF